MNSIKMIHTIARYYNTNERMTGLFQKITNQMILNCKFNIINFMNMKKGDPIQGTMNPLPGKKMTHFDDSRLWDSNIFPPEELIAMFKECQELKEAYVKQYMYTKERLETMPKAKQFDFSPQQIFSKFDLFTRRVGKLIDLFSTIRQFSILQQHNLEDIDPIVADFTRCVQQLKKKNHKLLDYTSDTLDRDFVEFNVEVSHVENSLASYIDKNFECIVNIEDSLKLLRKFRSILHRDNLQAGLQNKYSILFSKYSQLLLKLEEQYQKHRNQPPIVRNLPTVSGSITWSRHLFHRASVPMEHFPKELLRNKESKKPVKQVAHHNRITYTLFYFEYEWRQRWIVEVEKAKTGLLATLIIRHPNNNKLYVNFDAEILTLIREAKCLSRIGIEIPESAKIVLLQEEKFKAYNNELQFVLGEYDRIVNKIRPNTKSLLVPHLEDLEYKLRPGMVTLTWTSMNIDGYLDHVHAGLAKLEQLIININDIMENRIENNLKALSKTVLVNLPQESSTYTLDEFVEMQSEWISSESKKLKSKNYEVEQAVEDLIQTICSYQLDAHVEPISAEEIQKLSKYYSWSMYQALLHATKYSLNQMKERICGRRNAPKQVLKPFFEVDVLLDGQESSLKPSLDEVQSAINRAASHVLKSTRRVQLWFQKDLPEEDREPFYNWIAKDKEIVKVILLLTGSIQGTKNNVGKFLESFSKYNWLWSKNPNDQLKKFTKENPSLEDYEGKLKEFDLFVDDIKLIKPSFQIGALSLKTINVKNQLSSQITNWKDVYSRDIHKKAKTLLEGLTDEIKQIRLKIEKPVKVGEIDSLGGVMGALDEIRKKQSNIDFQFKPVTDMYGLIEVQMADNMDRDELDQKKVLEKDWEDLVSKAFQVRDSLHADQADFKKNLIKNVETLTVDVHKFRADFEENGPTRPNLEPAEALNRLKNFNEEYGVYARKFNSYEAGETLFSLPHQTYPELKKTKGELEKLDKLYTLYSKVTETISKWHEMGWNDIIEEMPKMLESVENFSRDCQRLPGDAKRFTAYTDLRKKIDDMEELLPLVECLAHESIRDRHWEEIIELCGTNIPYQNTEQFQLSIIFEANLLHIKEEIEDITDSALKQAKIERQLRDEIDAFWDECELDIKSYSTYDYPCTIGGTVFDVQEKLEEHVMALVQMNAMRCVTPFKDEVTGKITMLGEVQETIEKWLNVQKNWMNLVSVFTAGDIAKQMPMESKTFRNVDNQWKKIMERAAEQKNVIQCCQNDILLNSLPGLQEQLDFCQKRLENYLEQKRGVFPRFYFCSNSDLLKILSFGSDPHQVQDDFEKLFDAIHKVTFDQTDRRLIRSIHQIFGGAEEIIELETPVKCEGNIENWLCTLELEMQKSVRATCASAARDLGDNLLEFVDRYQSQIALLGIQLIWTSKVQDSLERTRDKIAEFEKQRKEIQFMMQQLTGECKKELPNNLIRTKIETLVTIHVYQRELFMRIQDQVKAHTLKDPSDFEWLKNTRVYWKVEGNQDGHICIGLTDNDFIYQYEFLGAKERLCVTELTERCYITLAQALKMNYGGAPAGPAGTGKTETVKDLGRTLGIFVIVTNCSGEHKFRNMGKIFKGVCQSGLWGCFDEFNRISLATLSVVASQVESIIAAKKQKLKQFIFPTDPDKPVRLNLACGVFVTMNPGYAGRQELPENLKVLFRGVTMLFPDRRIIIKVKLASVGYMEFDGLDRKFTCLYKLCEEQLSKQRHYDFGLRNILSVLRFAGRVLREESEGSTEEILLARTLTDMNMSKFVYADKSLFSELIGDIFPAVTGKIKSKDHKQLGVAIRKRLTEQNLVNKPDFFLKVIQLYETSTVRHGFMVVGKAGCGKTTIYNILTQALSDLPDNPKYVISRMNPKSLKGTEMYGTLNPVGEWEEGVFSNIWKKLNAKSNKNVNWIQCDGPVDSLWIENLNTVLDDNKILTLANAERIPMNDLTKMTFEVENLDNASPATVSRCGQVYVSPNELSWEPLFEAWAGDRADKGEPSMVQCHPDEESWIKENVNKFFIKNKIFYYISKHLDKNVMYAPEVIKATQFINLATACYTEYSDKQQEVNRELFDKIWTYAFAWAIGGLFETEERLKFHKDCLEKIGAPVPQISEQKRTVERESIYDYYINPETRQWELWQPDAWTPPRRIVFSQLLIPTADSTRAEYIINKISKLHQYRSDKRKEWGMTNTLLVGGVGTAKTASIIMYSNKFKPEEMTMKRINFSYYTLPHNFQEAIDAEVERKNAKLYRPPGDKQMTIFLDDVSMPQVNEWGDQITLEITRQLIDHKGFFFLDKEQRGLYKNIMGLQFVAAMGHPGNGRNDIPNRLKRLFFSVNMAPISNRSIENIYGRINEVLFNPKKYTPEVVNMRPLLIDATIAIWEKCARTLLPTPTKFHYSFNIRELARVFGGIARVAQLDKFKVINNSSKLRSESKPSPQLFVIGLWRHEVKRTFEDKLMNDNDKKIFKQILENVTQDKFRDSLGYEDEQLKTEFYFADFQRDDEYNDDEELVAEAPFVYEAVPDMNSIRKRVNIKLEAFNDKFPAKKMNLVIFDDALKHLLRLTRIVNAPSGNCLIVGVGGSGKQSLTKLAAYICKHTLFQIALTKTYNLTNLMEEVKELYLTAGPGGQSVTFLMTDADVKSESFLEAINSHLATGEIPGLLLKEDRDVIPLQCRPLYMKEIGQKGEDPSALVLWTYFISRVKDHLHMILAFSPVGNKFRERAQKFPSLFNECSIDWVLPWPEEALISVSTKFLGEFQIECTDKVKQELMTHMGKVHNMVSDVCTIYFLQMRRNVYVTPKSYLSFIQAYSELYNKKYKAIDNEEQNVVRGLDKLAVAAADVEGLKVDLAKKGITLKAATEDTDKLLKVLDVENKKADKKASEVNAVTQACMAKRNEIETERKQANEELQAALPFLHKAEKAVDSIQQKDITEIKKVSNARDTVKIIFDTVNILFMQPLVPVRPKEVEVLKKMSPWIADSYEEHARNNLLGPLLKNLGEFSANDKDSINEETIEFLEPYIQLRTLDDEMIFVPEVAKITSNALEGLCTWCGAMSSYHKASKIVKPKLRMLEVKTVELEEAQAALKSAQEELDEVNAVKAKLKAQYDEKTAYKQELTDDSNRTKKKMDQANRLINSLEDNKVRWIENAKEFANRKKKLVGNVAKACAFVSYCGPFNSEFRKKLTIEYFQADLEARGIPAAQDLKLTEFLVDQSTVGEWNMQGLPTDDLSIQNGIMVTRSTRYPLMIDPQSQAMSWIKNREPVITERNFIYSMNNPNLKDHLKVPLQDGMPVMIENIENEVDPMLDPLLEKQFIKRGRNKIIKIADQDLDYDEKFMLYMTSRLANPHFSPELAAKTTIIDFTVTQGGLEQQLLGRLISKEQKSLEEQLTQLQEDVTANTKILADAEDQLLQRLASGDGNLLDDTELIDVLAEIKTKAKEVTEKLLESKEKAHEIGEKREQYRPVASRGAVLYFCMVEMSLVNWMYNSSLQQFLALFDYGIDNSPKAQLVKDRVYNIIQCMTLKVYRYENRGLFERDKTTFKLMVCLKVLIQSGALNGGDASLFLKAGAGIDDRNKKFNWMEQKIWLNVLALSRHRFAEQSTCFFKDFPDKIQRNEQVWKNFFLVSNEPENTEMTKTDYDEKIENDEIGHFLHLCLVRCCREDRATLSTQQFIRAVLGKEFMDPVTDHIVDNWEESAPNRPILYLLAAGADPTAAIDEFARKKKINTMKVSMGEEQEIAAKANILNGFRDGFWVILNNCHLSLEFMAELEDILNPKNVEIHPQFRLFLTCEPHKEFPLGLLRMAIKVCQEPPKGLQAGLSRTYSTMINGDFLEKVEPYEKWKSMVFMICFMHSIVWERRKYGPIGFCQPYEFNTCDLEASITFAENHMNLCQTHNIPYQWRAIQYMICEIQYGGRITDGLDRELFNTYGNIWIQEKIFTEPEFCFNQNSANNPDMFTYIIPTPGELPKYMTYINEMPEKDNPMVFGLHNTADMSYRLRESKAMLDTLIDTMPKESGGVGGKTPEESVREKLEQDLIKSLPPDFVELEYKEQILKIQIPTGLDPKMNIPLNTFLRQEIEQFQLVLSIVRNSCNQIVDAIQGNIIMTQAIVDSIMQIYDFRVPRKWQFDATGVEISWLTPSLGGWMKGLLDRHYQLINWVSRTNRPISYWMTGFYNPQGFLTAVLQEVTRQHSADKWSLDQVETKADVSKDMIMNEDGRVEKQLPQKPQGVLIHGLFLEGASWNKSVPGGFLEDQTGKEMFSVFPVIHVTAQSTMVVQDRNPNAVKKPTELERQQKYDYSCPVYKYPKRSDKYLIFRAWMKAEPPQSTEIGVKPSKQKEDGGIKPSQAWKLKGVALLCCKD